MDKINYSQLELFSQSKDYDRLRSKQKMSKTFLSYIWNYEKTLLIIIGFIISGIVSFSLGVEKGKKLAILKTNSHLDIAVKIQQPAINLTTSQNRYQPVIKKQDSIQQAEPKNYIQNYTIQVASYQSKTHAQKEAEALRKKGVTPLVLSKGDYIIVCVGNFSNRDAAKSLLLDLRKRYQDCYIRRL